jgi:AcrR family transcriptional regulator
VEEKKIEILTRASGVILRHGVRSVTMDDITLELGISKKTLYQYFSDKDSLINAIIDLKLENDRAICLSSIENAENAIDALFLISKAVCENVGSVNPTVFYDLRKHYPGAWQKVCDHKMTFVYDMILNNIQRGIKEGIYRENMNPEVVARLFVAYGDVIMSGEIFPWPEFHYDQVYFETTSFHICGMSNKKGIEYLNKRELNE